jgi:hypothetical protein
MKRENTSLLVSEFNNVEKIEVGPSGNNFPSALNPNIDLIAKINEIERKNRPILKTWCILINSVFMRHFFKYP